MRSALPGYQQNNPFNAQVDWVGYGAQFAARYGNASTPAAAPTAQPARNQLGQPVRSGLPAYLFDPLPAASNDLPLEAHPCQSGKRCQCNGAFGNSARADQSGRIASPDIDYFGAGDVGSLPIGGRYSATLDVPRRTLRQWSDQRSGRVRPGVAVSETPPRGAPGGNGGDAGFAVPGQTPIAWDVTQRKTEVAIRKAKTKLATEGVLPQVFGGDPLWPKVGALADLSCMELHKKFLDCQTFLRVAFVTKLANNCRHSKEYGVLNDKVLLNALGGDCGWPCAATQDCSLAQLASSIGCPDEKSAEGLACVMAALEQTQGAHLVDCSAVDLVWPISKVFPACYQLARSKFIWEFTVTTPSSAPRSVSEYSDSLLAPSG